MTEQNRYGDGTVFEGVRSKDSEIKTIEVDEIFSAFETRGFKPGDNRLRCFVEGIRYAEGRYGIGMGDD